MAVYRPLDDALPALQRLLVQMSGLVADQFTEAVDALMRCDTVLAEEVRRRDDEVDALELEVDRECERVLALYQPVAGELRALIVAVKVNADLERIGDHAKNIAKDVKRIACSPGTLDATRLPEMADAVRRMLRAAHDAFVRHDRTLAERVLTYDRDVDKLHRANFAALLDHARRKPEDLEAVAHLLTASKAMERIADHAKSVAKGVVFLIEGEDLRHRRLLKRTLAADTPAAGGGMAASDTADSAAA